MKQASKSEQKYAAIRLGMAFGLILLVIQFVLGMYMNFYTELPDKHPGTSGSFAPSIPWALAGHAGVVLALHVTVWILLTFGSIALVVRSILARHKVFIIGSVLGLLFVIMAGSGGLAFLNRGGADRESMMMSLGFILAMITYAVTFYKTRP